MEEDLGHKLKALRLERKMTLKELSEKANLSISFLSQVERSKSSVTLASLRRIAESLNVTPSFFFNTSDNVHPNITRNEDKNEHQSNQLHFTYTNLSKNIANPLFEPVLAVLSPGERDNRPYAHRGQEFIYVLDGIVTIILNNEKHLLYPGDSIHIESTIPHVWYNDTDEQVKLLIVSSAA